MGLSRMAAREIYHYKDNYWQVIDEELLKPALTAIFIAAGEPFNPLRITSAVDSLRLTLPLMDKPPPEGKNPLKPMPLIFTNG